jgi:hypothetical protein
MAGLTQMLKQVQHDILKKFNQTDVELLQNMEGKKIYDCSDTEIKQVLAYCCLMVGIDRPPGDDKKMVLIAFLRKYYGTITNKQIGQAFELVAAGELGTGPQEHYNNMSPMYMGNVLRAYLQKLNGVKQRYETRKRSNDSPKSTPEAYYRRLVKVVEEYNVIPVFWAWDEVYDYLAEANAFLSDASPEVKKETVIKYFKEKYPEAMLQMLGI